MSDHPVLMHTVLDAEDPAALADFYAALLGCTVREDDDPDWFVVLDADGRRVLAFQRADKVTPSTWPSPEVPQQLHLDFAVPTLAALHQHRREAERLGARLILDRVDDEEEPLYVLADPAGHPFCLLVGPG